MRYLILLLLTGILFGNTGKLTFDNPEELLKPPKQSINLTSKIEQNPFRITPFAYIGQAAGIEHPMNYLLGLKFGGGVEFGYDQFALFLNGGTSINAGGGGIHSAIGFRFFFIKLDYAPTIWKVYRSSYDDTKDDWWGITHNIGISMQILPISLRVSKNMSYNINVPYDELSDHFQDLIDLGWSIEIMYQHHFKRGQ